MVTLRDADVGPQPATTAHLRATETKAWQTSFRKALIQLECPGQQNELLNFQMEVTNILNVAL